MIALPVDEAYVFDYLAILYVKQERKLPVGGELWNLRCHLMQANVPVMAIECSPEFRELQEANRKVFDLIEKAYKDECKASVVQEANHKRYLAKVALQKRFWPDVPLSETKTR